MISKNMYMISKNSCMISKNSYIISKNIFKKLAFKMFSATNLSKPKNVQKFKHSSKLFLSLHYYSFMKLKNLFSIRSVFWDSLIRARILSALFDFVILASCPFILLFYCFFLWIVCFNIYFFLFIHATFCMYQG